MNYKVNLKSIFWLCFLFLIAVCFNSFAFKNVLLSMEGCLEINGTIICREKPVEGCIVRLLYENKVVDYIKLDKKNKFTFTLKKSRYYTIEISKEGFDIMLIGVSTIFPEGVFSRELYKHALDIELVKETKKKGGKEVNDDSMDFPIAIIEYIKTGDTFGYNKKYTSQIKSEIKQAKNK